ncbi:hypothetical protein Sjap_009538 [Stephania japonica]|uniref:BHLH domain-containing protein n=1 Tax=Stephania japonica TaxID=461633 RepID=A0AAP0JS62_9MAGN
MYPASQHGQGPQGHMGGNLSRYGSAPSSFLSTVVDSVLGSDGDSISAVGSDPLIGRYFSPTSDSTSSDKPSPSLDRSYAFPAHQIPSSSSAAAAADNIHSAAFRGGGAGPSQLIRHSSSPAGFFNHHLSLAADKGGLNPYSSQVRNDGHGIPNGRLKTQLSFTRQESLPQISEVSESIAEGSSSDEGQHNLGQSYGSGSFSMGSWDNNTIMFSAPPSKQAKDINGDIAAALSGIDSDSQFSLPRAGMSNFEKLLQLQKDSVPCKIRAKRGFATHPRSIAERERRSRISRKMKKLQELVPNMDKQTSNADMLDLAIQYIKNLQNEVQLKPFIDRLRLPLGVVGKSRYRVVNTKKRAKFGEVVEFE